MDDTTRRYLNNQFAKLGEMMGDGLHLEPDGKWISKEYRKIGKTLGYIAKADRSERIKAINSHMIKRVADVKCQACHGELKQTKSGSKRAKCQTCGWLWQLLK